MYDENLEYPDHKDGKVQAISPREILMKYIPFLPWIVISVTIFLVLAFLKLRYSPNIYSVNSTILIKDPTANSGGDKLDQMLFSQPNKSLYDEMQVIRSLNMAKRVVRSLEMEVQYYNQGKIRSTQISSTESPIHLRILYLRDSLSTFNIQVTVLDDKHFTIVEKGQQFLFGQIFETSSGRFSLEKTIVDYSHFSSNIFFVNYASVEQRAGQFLGGLSVSQSGESNNILQLTYETENTTIGIDIVNQWMKEYQQAGLEDKKQIAVNALQFINEEMDTVRLELGGVEKHLLGYREKNKVINPEQQSLQVFNTLSELEKEITKQGVQVQVLDNLMAYISDTRNPYRQVGSTLGIAETSLAGQILEFNKMQVERETMLKTTTRLNPMIVQLETAIEKLRIDIIQNLKNVREAYILSINNLRERNQLAGQEVSQIPSKEKELLDITRRQKILEELFSFLLKKKLETSISSASTISNVRVIESARSSGAPVKPTPRSTYLMALLIGVLIPALIIFLIEYLNDKVKSREDIQKITQAPMIGEVGHSDEKSPLVVSRFSRRFISEQFRILRTNLQYVLPKQEKAVILVTSSSSGEGKSFISTNVGAVMALAGKKTAILEFDLRKPKIMSSLNLAKKTGITNFIIGKASFEELAEPVPGVDNLFVIPCGAVPPNPAELLLSDKLDELMQNLKKEFEMIIIDTAPVGLVSDANILGKYADATIYVVRHDYTYKKQLQLLNDIYVNRRLPKMSLVINDIKVQGIHGKYYGYAGYGYSTYGYGYGSAYFDDNKPVNGVFNKVKNFFANNGKKGKDKV